MLVQKTPSVYFQFDDTALKSDRSQMGFFDLSCTNQKNNMSSPVSIKQLHFVQQQQEPRQEKISSKLKTQDFFEQFDNNFKVTFDSDDIAIGQRLSKTGDCTNLLNSVIQSTQLERMAISAMPLNNRSLSGNAKNQGSVLNSQTGDKQKSSPIPSFQVKKRTVFKSKANIAIAQTFKITKKKIINQNNLEEFLQPSTLQPQKKNSLSIAELYTQKVKSKAHRPAPQFVRSDNFFSHLQAKRSLKSTTLDSWRKRFNQIKKQSDSRGQRANIFVKPVLLR